MKKNFMAIASLLIAAMLLVVSCAPEAKVEGKVEDGLVEAVIGLGRSAKDIDITSGNKNAQITYKYKMTAAWESSDTGAPIYGEVAEGTIGTFSLSAPVENKKLGMVTPGLWNIEVKGYCKVDGVDKLVLQGKASAYFNGSGTRATVFVAPVSTDETVRVTITLKMQDLDKSQQSNYDRIGYAFTDLGGVNSSIVEKPATDHVMLVDSSVNNVNTYATTIVNVKSGFNTVTFSLPGYDNGKGGITKTFLAIPGVPVTITGSVTPAEFVAGTADIKVLSIDGGKVTVTAATGSAKVEPGEIIKEADEVTNTPAVRVQQLANGDTYIFNYSDSHSDNNDTTFSAATAGATELKQTYQWYVGSKKITSATTTSFEFNETAAGDYNVTCVETVTFKIDGQPYQLQTSATMPYVRVLEAPAQSGSNTGTGEGGSTTGTEGGGSSAEG